MCLSYIVSIIAICALVYLMYFQSSEGFYPYRGWGGHGSWGGGWGGRSGYGGGYGGRGSYGGRWGWNRSYLRDWGNWRPYGYYPAYSGYWKECPSGTWCPPYVSCNDPSCQ